MEIQAATTSHLHYQHHSSQIFSCLSPPDKHSSFVQVTGSCSASTFSTHKLLLAAASPFLCQLLRDSQSESTCLLLPDFSSSNLQHLSQFLTTGEISCLSESEYSSSHQLLGILQLLPEHHKLKSSSTVLLNSGEDEIVVASCNDTENEVTCSSKVECSKSETESSHSDDLQYLASTPVKESKVQSNNSAGIIEESLKLVCPHCEKLFVNQVTFDAHVRNKHELKPYACKVCNKEFGNKSSYFKHKKTHSDIATKSICDVCGGNYKDAHTLKVHVQTQHLMLEKPYACEVCGDRFKTRGSLKIHNSKHEEERAFVCDECGFQTKNKWLLKAHLKTHQTLKDFQCPHCPKTFNFQFILDKHIRIHTNERPYPCETCGTSFVSGIHLRRHQKSVHKSVRDFVCNICSAPFKRLSELKRHIILHSNERPFECNVCGSTFKHREAGRRHSKAAHPGITGSIAYKPTEAIVQLATRAIKKLSQEEVGKASFITSASQTVFPQDKDKQILLSRESNSQNCIKEISKKEFLDLFVPSRPKTFSFEGQSIAGGENLSEHGEQELTVLHWEKSRFHPEGDRIGCVD